MFPFLFGLYQFINAFNRNTPSIIKNIGTIKQELSLIVVDDALVLLKDSDLKFSRKSLNPCCAGRCSSTEKTTIFCLTMEEVSILVVLDDALVQNENGNEEKANNSLNPCCAGRCSST